ncbi:MAG: 50S ribosomal protein P1 [Candidatus Marsarchaeota archaeon]|nr:50S ribosomal protein P1 [Candidatus Marsarchaeota archaeon]
MTKIDPYLHAALLLKGADKEISEAHITAVVKSAGIEVDSARAKVLAEALKGVNFDDVLKAAAAPVAVAAAPAAAGEAKKEEKKEDPAKSEAAAAEGLASLFG